MASKLFHVFNEWIIVFGILITEIAIGIAIDVHEGSGITIPCPLNATQYPVWTGPDELVNPLTDNQTIREPDIEWDNNKDLRITRALLKHDGNYTCESTDGRRGNVQLNVEYFMSRAYFTTASESNRTAIFTCESYSNPRSKIGMTTVSRVRIPGPNMITNITINKCQQDPSNDNRTRCSVDAVMTVWKEDNGVEMSCDFNYSNYIVETRKAKVIFLFPPTMVNITGNRPVILSDNNKATITLTCSTDSANPVSSLSWRIGKYADATQNLFIYSSYNTQVMDAEYNGRNISQAIDIQLDPSMNGEHVLCCAHHTNTTYCESVSLETILTSGGDMQTAWLTSITICLIMTVASKL